MHDFQYHNLPTTPLCTRIVWWTKMVVQEIHGTLPLVHINFHSSNDNKFLNFISSLKQVTRIICIPRL